MHQHLRQFAALVAKSNEHERCGFWELSMSLMQITNSPRELGSYHSEFHSVMAYAVQQALGLDPFVAGMRACELYGPKLEAAACMAGWELKVPTPVAFAALARNQMVWAKDGYGKIELALSRTKRDAVKKWATIAAYCEPTLNNWPNKMAVIGKVMLNISNAYPNG